MSYTRTPHDAKVDHPETELERLVRRVTINGREYSLLEWTKAKFTTPTHPHRVVLLEVDGVRRNCPCTHGKGCLIVYVTDSGVTPGLYVRLPEHAI